MKFILKIIVVALILLVVRIVTPFLDLYPYRLTKEYYLIGYGFNKYCIKDGFFGKIVITSMGKDSEWMIDSNFIYGHRGNIYNLNDNYFLINRKTDSVYFFEDSSKLNTDLRKNNLPIFNMTDTEKVVHLGTNTRKFKLKTN